MSSKDKYKAHPWHGISPGDHCPDVVVSFIEIVPTDTVKYEIDKKTGYLSIDRPQRYSNTPPTMYGFIPQTYCGRRVAEVMNQYMGRDDIEGDEDPLDICVLTEKDIMHGDIIVRARPIGGFRLLDKGKADDKLIAVLEQDAIYSRFNDINELPKMVLDRMIHYFTTYKDLPKEQTPRTILESVYGAADARDLITRAREDYDELIHSQFLRL